MSSKTTTILVIIVFILSFFSLKYYTSYHDLLQKYDTVKKELKKVKTSYYTLINDYNYLSQRYNSLSRKYDNLNNEYKKIKFDYDILKQEYTDLKSKYDKLYQDYQKLDYAHRLLEQKVAKLAEEYDLRAGILIEEAPKLIDYENSEIGYIVYSVTKGWDGSESDKWNDWLALYNWVRKNIKYTYDKGTKYIIPRKADIAGEERIVDIQVGWAKDYWKYASETLRDRKGDCEDMAILLAALIKYYNIHCVKINYAYYVFLINFYNKNSGHAALLIPVQGGRITILDPAGNYYTSYNIGFFLKVIYAYPIETELQNYQKHIGKIKNIYAIFNDQTYHKFKNLQQFINHFKK